MILQIIFFSQKKTSYKRTCIRELWCMLLRTLLRLSDYCFQFYWNLYQGSTSLATCVFVHFQLRLETPSSKQVSIQPEMLHGTHIYIVSCSVCELKFTLESSRITLHICSKQINHMYIE